MMRGLLAVACIVAAQPVLADPKEDAMRVIERWAKAFSASDVDGIVSLYSADATFLGTGSKTVVTRTSDIRRYFEDALSSNRPRGATLRSADATVLSDAAVVVTGLDTVTSVRDGQPVSADGRVTFVVAPRGADWKIVHFHRSAMPR